MRIFIKVFIMIFLLNVINLNAARLKDIINIKGVRDNQLIGYGLVVGLNGTGDDGKKTSFTLEALTNMLRNMGITVSKSDIDSDNIAAVVVTADLPPFAKSGMKIDVNVSSLGDAKSIEGGTLLMTPLKGPDGVVYAVAQGPVSTGGYLAGTGGGKNFPTAGRIPEGAIIEKEVPFKLLKKHKIFLTLKNPDFSTSSKVADTINLVFGKNIALPIDSSTIKVNVPENDNIVRFISRIEKIDVTPETAARVVINERTGTVVIGENVHISTVAIAHGNLSIQIKETPEVSQPNPLAEGNTVVTNKKRVQVKEETRKLMLVDKSVRIKDLVKGLNSIGVSPRDLISILQAIKQAGALQGELVIM